MENTKFISGGKNMNKAQKNTDETHKNVGLIVLLIQGGKKYADL